MTGSASTRPRSLYEVARRVLDGEQEFDTALREFLDTYYANPEQREAAISKQPRPLDALMDAYIAAVAEHLARSDRLKSRTGLNTRGWTSRCHSSRAGCNR